MDRQRSRPISRFSTRYALAAVVSVFVLSGPAAMAEPYLAVQKGLKCGTCHVSPSGGGMRTPYGNLYAQTEFPARTLKMGELWTGEIGKYLAVGGNIRASYQDIDVPGQPSVSSDGLDELLAYVEIRPFPKYLSLYVDARLRPDDPLIREQYARVSLPGGRWSLRAGEFFLPYGLRLQDGSQDSASAGTFVSANGVASHLDNNDVAVTVLDTWDSPEGGTYPSRWRLQSTQLGLDIEVTPVLADQELFTTVRYWEGAVNVSGSHHGVGYLEMSGYTASP